MSDGLRDSDDRATPAEILETAAAMIAEANLVMFWGVTDENRERVEPLRYDARVLANKIKDEASRSGDNGRQNSTST